MTTNTKSRVPIAVVFRLRDQKQSCIFAGLTASENKLGYLLSWSQRRELWTVPEEFLRLSSAKVRESLESALCKRYMRECEAELVRFDWNVSEYKCLTGGFSNKPFKLPPQIRPNKPLKIAGLLPEAA